MDEEVTITESNASADCALTRKRKLSISDGPTPKRPRGCQHQLGIVASDALSPISTTAGVSTVGKKFDAKRYCDTPEILSKFDFTCTGQDNCMSTPIPNKGFHAKHFAKKHILKFEKCSNDSKLNQSSSPVQSKDPNDMTIDELIDEISSIVNENESKCSDVTVLRNDPQQDYDDIAAAEIESMLSDTIVNGNKLHFADRTVISGMVMNDQKQTDLISEIADADNKPSLNVIDYSSTSAISEVSGRFKNVDATISNIDFEEDDGEVTEDILGLENYDEDTLVDEMTLLAENSGEDEDSSNSQVNVTKVQNDKNDTKISEAADADITITVSPKKEVAETLVSSTTVQHVQRKENQATTIDVHVVKKTAKPVEKIRKEDPEPIHISDVSIIKSEDYNVLMKEVRRKWKLDGIPSLETNFTIATTYRKRRSQRGDTASSVLENEKLCCLNLYGAEIILKNSCASTDQVRCTELALERLYQKKEILNGMKCSNVFKLRQEMTARMDHIRDRHEDEMKHLCMRQEADVYKLRRSFKGMRRSMQDQRHDEMVRKHCHQMESLKKHHEREYTELCAHLNNVLEREKQRHKQNQDPVDLLISQLENSKKSCGESGDGSIAADARYGPCVIATLRKGPTRENDCQGSRVTMCQPAVIAQAMTLEDDIFDHFYRYGFSKFVGMPYTLI